MSVVPPLIYTLPMHWPDLEQIVIPGHYGFCSCLNCTLDQFRIGTPRLVDSVCKRGRDRTHQSDYINRGECRIVKKGCQS